MISRWTGNGPTYGLEWGGRAWRLDVSSSNPGVLPEHAGFGPLLSLDGVSSLGRDDRTALGGHSLQHHECRFGRVEALYVPAGWHSLRVRASWIPRDEKTLDLEIQLQAHTVDELHAVQAHVASHASTLLPFGHLNSVVLCAGSPAYLEISHPDDTAWRDLSVPGLVRYGLLGYDLERGVVLRGRLRGTWFPTTPSIDEGAAHFAAFLREPLPLGT